MRRRPLLLQSVPYPISDVSVELITSLPLIIFFLTASYQTSRREAIARLSFTRGSVFTRSPRSARKINGMYGTEELNETSKSPSVSDEALPAAPATLLVVFFILAAFSRAFAW